MYVYIYIDSERLSVSCSRSFKLKAMEFTLKADLAKPSTTSLEAFTPYIPKAYSPIP